MIRSKLHQILNDAVAGLIASGKLPQASYSEAEVSDPRSPEHGDYATNFAMVNAKAFGMNPRQLGEALASALSEKPEFAAVEVAGPGFINLRLQPSVIAATVSEVLAKGNDLPKSVHPAAQKINVEFVSVNPNGPITVGSGRGAAFGSTLCNVLEAAGHTVHREYYINDGVNSEQMRLFAESVHYYFWSKADYKQDPWFKEHPDIAELYVQALTKAYFELEKFGYCMPFERLSVEAVVEAADKTPELHQRLENNLRVLWSIDTQDRTHVYRCALVLLRHTSILEKGFPIEGYKGDYVQEVAAGLLDSWVFGQESQNEWYRKQSEQLMLKAQRSALTAFGVEFDTWFSEQSLHDAGVVEKCIDELMAKGVADEEEFRTVLKMGKKGEIQEVNKESQAKEVDDDDPNADASPSSVLQSENEEGGRGVDHRTLWLRSTKFGDDMDRVLKRKDGRLTYIASDVAYHKDKFNRPGNADKLITVLGPDHHGYIGRLQAVVGALLESDSHSSVSPSDGWSNDNEPLIYKTPAERDACQAALAEARRKLEVVIFQIVRFVKEGKPAPMRKRDGNIYALIDLIDELGKTMAPEADLENQRKIGRDVSRFFYLMRSHDTHMDFDIDLATKKSDENPVFYVQYAHARICSVIRKAAEAGIETPSPALRGRVGEGVDLNLLTHPKELALIKKIADLPYEVRRCSEDYGVHRLTSYAVELARSYHGFYDSCRVIQPEDIALSQARLLLCQAAALALSSALGILGISAPESM